MRLGTFSALIFIVLSFGVLFGSVEDHPVLNESVQNSMESTMAATKVVQEGDWGSFITVLQAPFSYFDSMVNIAWEAFNNPIFSVGSDDDGTGWAFVPYFVISPLVMVFFFGLIILLIGMLQKQI